MDDETPTDELNGHSVMTYTDFLAVESSKKHLTLSIANSSIWEKLAMRLFEDRV